MVRQLHKNKSNNLVAMFEEQLARKPANPAVIFGKQSLSYEELNQRANQLANYLSTKGLKAETPIAIYMARSIELLIVILGVLKAGCAYVPLDLTHPEERLLFILNDNQIPMLITTSEKAANFNRYKGELLLVDEEETLREQSVLNPTTPINPEQLAYIIFTSGSTGTPKGVLIEHRSIVNYARWFAQYSGLKPHERIDFSTSHAFDFALTSTIIPLLFGLTIVICEDRIKKDPNLYLNFLEENRVNYIKITPGYFRVLLYQEKVKYSPLNFLKSIILGGENLLALDCASWLALFPNHLLYNEYGPTEATVAVSVFQINRKNIKKLSKNVPIGKLMPNCRAAIFDEKGKPVTEGTIGELHLGGLCLARGYLNDQRLSDKFFIKETSGPGQTMRLYKTGDRCSQAANGQLDCFGRIDEQVKIRGFRVEPAEIENCLLLHPALHSAAVNVIEDYQKEKRLVAYYILKKQKKAIDEKELGAFLRRYLPEFMIPFSFVKMESFPLTANDKIDRKAFPLPAFRPIPADELPTSQLEKTIAEIWSNELGIETISVNANFFELGGHSLSAAKIRSNLTQILGKELSIENFYKNPTISSLAKLVKKSEKIADQNSFPEKLYRENHPLPLSDFQLTLWLSNLLEPIPKKINISARKRFHGHLDELKIKKAFKILLEKHEVLSYKISTFRPRQRYEKDLHFELIIKNLESHEQNQIEAELERSLNELSSYTWPKNSTPLQARLFYLPERKTELQLCMPHILADEVSLDILFSDLSHFYLSDQSKLVEKEKSYREYLYTEKTHVETHEEKDFIFWEDYLQDAALLSIPESYVSHKMKKNKLPYSRYTEFPSRALDKLRDYCAANHIGLDTGLSSLLFLALSNCCGALNEKSPISFNKVKSTRDETKYDNTIGCFLNVVPIKLKLNSQQDLSSLCQQIHRAMIATSPYQRCSNLVKIASISNFRHLGRMKDFAVKLLIEIYNYLLPKHQLNKKIVNSCARLTMKKENDFMINVNVQNSFLKTESEKLPLFGLAQERAPTNKTDLLAIDNVLDVSFLRLDDQKPYMVVSANLTREFHDLLAKEMLKLCETIQ